MPLPYFHRIVEERIREAQQSGGIADLTGRPLGAALERYLKQP